jgi:hypothetical protein
VRGKDGLHIVLVAVRQEQIRFIYRQEGEMGEVN